MKHWKLARDPFSPGGATYVSTPTHDEAVARLVHNIETGARSCVLTAGEGLGKSVVLSQALSETRIPTRRIVRVSSPLDGTGLLSALAEGLGARVPASASRSLAWRTLAQAVRLERMLKAQVVFAIDDIDYLSEPVDLQDIARLPHLDPHPSTRLTVVYACRPTDDLPIMGSWDLAIRLLPLTYSETEHYVRAKLAGAGRVDETFTPRAITRLHALAGGVPRGIDRLSALALMAGALRGLEMITLEVIEGVARECVLPAA